VEPLAFVEVLGRHHEVVARHPLARLPAHVGRGYDCDVILDDPYVAPRHLRIEPAADGRFTVSDLQSANGMRLLPAGQRTAQAQVGPDEIVRIGHTQIRVRPASYAVRPEMVLEAAGLPRRPAGFALMALALLALVLWDSWITIVSEDEKMLLVFAAIAVCVTVIVWTSIWSLVGRATGGHDNFPAHGFVACAGLAAIMVADASTDYLSFALDADWLEYLGVAAAAVIFVWMIYRHLRLNSRASGKKLGAVSAIASLIVFGTLAGMQMASDWMREGRMSYDSTIKAPVFLWVSGVPPTMFLARAVKLRSQADALAKSGAN
jgi:hypothetical protein